jgi:multimeric flavodoxin WrbA
LAALRIALEGARSAGASVRLFDVRELDLPMYDPALAAAAERSGPGRRRARRAGHALE